MHHSTGEGSTHSPPHHHLEGHDPYMRRVENSGFQPRRKLSLRISKGRFQVRKLHLFLSGHQSLCLILFQLSLLTDLHQPSTYSIPNWRLMRRPRPSLDDGDTMSKPARHPAPAGIKSGKVTVRAKVPSRRYDDVQSRHTYLQEPNFKAGWSRRGNPRRNLEGADSSQDLVCTCRNQTQREVEPSSERCTRNQG